MEDRTYQDDLQRITARMNQVHLANALVRKGQLPEALQLLRNVRDKYTEPAMVRQIELLIRDIQARAALPSLGPEPGAAAMPDGGPARAPTPSSTETRNTARPSAPARPDPAGALARARADLAAAEETIARARAEESARQKKREAEAGGA